MKNKEMKGIEMIEKMIINIKINRIRADLIPI